MYARKFSVSVVTDASGDATAYSDEVNGILNQARYVKNDFANGVDFTITSEATGETLWTESNVDASATRSPRQLTHSTAGVASATADGAIAVTGRIKVVVAAGGNAKTGTFHFVVL